MMKKIITIVIHIFAIIGFVLVVAYFAVKLGLTNTKGVIDNQHDYFKNQLSTSWKDGDEWNVLKQAILKDKEDIYRVSKEVGISSRLLVTPLVVEQLRLFHSNREIFKDVFSPLKVLGNQSQFSWGIYGIKQDAAREIEKRNPNPELLAFKTDNPDKERFERLTNEESRYYSYLYAAIYMKELIDQWKKAGFDISDRVDIIATLYNIGFDNSKPHADPQSGGAEIEIGKNTYSFGSLAKLFYDSQELIQEFPIPDHY